MDIATIIGILAFAGMIVTGVTSGELPATFLNRHGLGIVIGGTAVAMLINTPLRLLWEAAAALLLLFRDDRSCDGETVIAATVSLAEQVHAQGVSAFQGADSQAAGGFLKRAAQTAVEYNNADLVRQILENEVNQRMEKDNEIVNVYRTMGVLAPMFGLLGTLIGIVRVLKEIANPAQVGGAMAVAVTTAFYGITLANVICIPVAGKIRLRHLRGQQAQAMVVDGVLMMMKGSIPLAVKRKLATYL